MKSIIRKIRFFKKADDIIFVDRPIFYLADGAVVEDYSEQDFQSHAESCRIPEAYSDFELVSIMSLANAPAFNDTWQLYYENNEVKVDSDYMQQVMPIGDIVRRRINRLRDLRNAQITIENYAEVAKYTARIDNLKFEDNQEIYIQSLSDLIEFGEEKPIIEQKLNEIILSKTATRNFLEERLYPLIYLKE